MGEQAGCCCRQPSSCTWANQAEFFILIISCTYDLILTPCLFGETFGSPFEQALQPFDFGFF
jgi:hypothetical protein